MGFFAVRKVERRDVWTAFAALFMLIASHSVLETARDALFLAKVPATRLPWAYLALAAPVDTSNPTVQSSRVLPESNFR